MDLRDEILKEHSKRQTVKIATWIGKDKRRFRKLMELFLHSEYRITQRSAWIVSHCADWHPELITPWLPAMVKRMQEPGVHDSVKRNVVRILQFIEIPASLLGKVVSLCFQYAGSPDEPIAVRCFSMTVLVNAVRREPDLRNEVAAVIEQMLPYAGPGIRARARMALKQLNTHPRSSTASGGVRPAAGLEPS